MKTDFKFEHALELLEPEFVVGEDFFVLLTPEACAKEREDHLNTRINKVERFLQKRKADSKKSAFLIEKIKESIEEEYQYEKWYNTNTRYEISGLPIEIGDKIYRLHYLYLRPYPNHRKIQGYKVFLKKIYVSEKDVDILYDEYICVGLDERINLCIFIDRKFPMVMKDFLNDDMGYILEDFATETNTQYATSLFFIDNPSEHISDHLVLN